LQDFDGFSVRCFGEGAFNQFFEVLNMSLFLFLEELEILSVVFKDELDAELNVSFSALHDVKDIGKG
jgi:hypothetical protein